MNKNLKEIEYKALGDLKPHPRNPRVHSKRQVGLIADNIAAHGFNNPILIDETNTILAGHGRIAAAKRIGLTEVPTLSLSHLNEHQKLAYLLADNKLAEQGVWNKDILSLNVAELLKIDYDIELTGFATAEVDLTHTIKINAESEPDITFNYHPVSQLGDLWYLGKHRLYCGSALEPASYLALLDGEQAQMLFTDPPYNVPIAGHVKRSASQAREFAMAAGEMTSNQFSDFLESFLRASKEVMVDGAILYICMDWRHMPELHEAASGLLELKQLCVWAKDRAGMGSFYRSQHELVFVFKNGTVPHINNFGLGATGRYRSNIWNYQMVKDQVQFNDLPDHPTPKPLALVIDAIKDCSKRNGIVLDPFVGSGTTILAAEATGRRAYGIELDPTYIDLTILRWQQQTGEAAKLASTGATYEDIKQTRTGQSGGLHA